MRTPIMHFAGDSVEMHDSITPPKLLGGDFNQHFYLLCATRASGTAVAYVMRLERNLYGN
jgi:hypothetical protein